LFNVECSTCARIFVGRRSWLAPEGMVSKPLPVFVTRTCTLGVQRHRADRRRGERPAADQRDDGEL